LGDLMNLTSERDPKLQWVNVRGVIDEVYASLAPQLAAQEVETVTDVPRHLGILVDASLLRSAIVNLVLNALEAMPDGGRLVVTSYTGRGGLELEVADSGPGLSDDVRNHAFEPFFSTKNGGVGLGLAVVHRVAQMHGGSVVAMNCPEGGAAFTLRFPQRASQAAA
jgi:signal transduction histidine kinase